MNLDEESSYKRVVKAQIALGEEAHRQNEDDINERIMDKTIHNLEDFTLMTVDREFERKHEANPPSQEEEAYRSLADYVHNELPIDKFISDHVMDDPRMNRLIVECLKRQFSGFHATDTVLGENLVQIVSEAFRDYVSLVRDE